MVRVPFRGQTKERLTSLRAADSYSCLVLRPSSSEYNTEAITRTSIPTPPETFPSTSNIRLSPTSSLQSSWIGGSYCPARLKSFGRYYNSSLSPLATSDRKQYHLKITGKECAGECNPCSL